MSFPPRPPMMPHGMPPMINQPPYSYSGMPMPPMPPMGMMMNRPPPSFAIMNAANKIPALANINAPVTKVFVGNISERAPDSMIRQMLQRCGSVIHWKRVEGTNGKLQAFGFCEFAEPQYTLRCIRLLNGYEIAEKKLLVKVDQKTRELLGEYIKKNRPDKTKNARKAASLRNIRGTLIRPNDDDTNADATEEDDPKTINLEAVDEDTLKEDRHTIGALELILKQYGKDLNPPEVAATVETPEKIPTVAPAPHTPTPTVAADTENSPVAQITDNNNGTDNNNTNGVYMKPHLRLEEIKLDDDKKELMTSEISKFRETHKDEEIRIKQEEKDRLSRIQEKERIEKDRIKASERRNRRDRSNDRNRRSRSRSQHNNNNNESPYRSSRREQRRQSIDQKEVSHSPDNHRRSKQDNNNNKENNNQMTQEEIEEERERKKLERKLRDKELAYRARLKLWEEREDKKRRGYLIEKDNDLKKKKIMLKEARKLKQFMEDYDDDKDDSSFFKGSSLEKKLKFREKEIESDNRDRQREKEELEELKKRLLEKGFNDVDHEAKRIQEDENVRMKIKFEKIDESSSSSESSESDNEIPPQEPPKIIEKQIETVNKMDSEVAVEETSEKMNVDEAEAEAEAAQVDNHIISEDSISSPFNQGNKEEQTVTLQQQVPDNNNDAYSSSPNNSNSPVFHGFNNTPTAPHVTIKAVKVAKSIQPINQAFADEDDEPNGPKRAKLISTSESTSSSGMNSDERKKAVKKLVESIPTDRDELFAYPVDWEQLDIGLMEKRIKPWINKKIIEYIGEEEATLHDFICSKIQQRTKPDKLLEEIKVILDDEAELFVKKMWRLIVYETESKRCGLSK